MTDSSPVLLAAATRWEADPIRERLGLARRDGASWSGRIAGRPVTLLKTGMGGQAAEAALARACAPGEASPLLVSAGFAGATREGLRAGDLVAEELTPCPRAARALERTAAPRVRFGAIADSDRVLCDPRDKLALGRRTGALAVDMESSALRAFAVRRGCPALALRVVLDEAEFALPPDLPGGEDALSLARYAAGRPAQWPRLTRLWLRQSRASAVLASAVKAFLEAL